MADLPSEPLVDARLREFLAAELRQAEVDFPHLAKPARRLARRRLSIRILTALVAVLAFVVVAPRLVERAGIGMSGTPTAADGLPFSIDGEPVARGAEIAARLSGGSFLAGGVLILDTSPCLSRSARAQLGCGEGWELVVGPIDNPAAVFVLDGVAVAPGFVRTSGARTVARVRAWKSLSGEMSGEILVVDAVVWRQPTKGPIPADATPPEGGTMNDALVPDFVSALNRDGLTIAGYVPKRYILGGGDLTPGGSPANPPQTLPDPVYGEDLATVVGHMVPGVGFVAVGATDIPAGPRVSVGPSVAPSPSVSSASAEPSGILPPAIADCGRISSAACAQAIALARAGHETEVSSATRIVVDDTCPSTALCDRLYPFDSVVVYVTAGRDMTGWYTFHVYGLEYNTPTKAEPWLGDVPAHVVQRLLEP